MPEGAEIELLADFVTETREQLEACESALLDLEADETDVEAVHTVFRGFHTIKGSAACLGLPGISELAHRAESLLSRVRDGEIRCTRGYADLALRSLDALKQMSDGVRRWLEGERPAPPDGIDELMHALADPESAGYGEAAPAATPGTGTGAEPGRPSPEPAVETVRVQTDRLDRLIDLVGELVVAQSMVVQDQARLAGDQVELGKKISRAGKIVRELQDLSLSMRMVPLRGVFRKMSRVVRDIAARSGKRVGFATEGEDTEIDRTMVETIADPLVHMVRNAVDHGIETSDERRKAGKPEQGTVRLRAFHAGGNVVLQLGDDGRGLDREKILRKAVDRGMLARTASPSDAEVWALLLEPGFSTAERITDVSGRGVGLDVVKRNVEALQGRIEIGSTPGRGTTFSIRLPLTLAIADGMMVRVGGQRFIVPTLSVFMSFRPEPGQVRTVQGRGELVRFRDAVLPLFRLGELFGVEGGCHDPGDGLLMVLDDGDRRFALLVDELVHQHQVVVKSLGAAVGRIRGISGAAILGDGAVGLILEPGEVGLLGREHSRKPMAPPAA